MTVLTERSGSSKHRSEFKFLKTRTWNLPNCSILLSISFLKSKMEMRRLYLKHLLYSVICHLYTAHMLWRPQNNRQHGTDSECASFANPGRSIGRSHFCLPPLHRRNLPVHWRFGLGVVLTTVGVLISYETAPIRPLSTTFISWTKSPGPLSSRSRLLAPLPLELDY